MLRQTNGFSVLGKHSCDSTSIKHSGVHPPGNSGRACHSACCPHNLSDVHSQKVRKRRLEQTAQNSEPLISTCPCCLCWLTTLSHPPATRGSWRHLKPLTRPWFWTLATSKMVPWCPEQINSPRRGEETIVSTSKMNFKNVNVSLTWFVFAMRSQD